MVFVVLVLACALPVRAQEAVAPLIIPPLPALNEPPTFRIKVESDWRIETPLQVIRRELAEDSGAHRIVPGGGTTPPLVAVDVLPAIVGFVKQIRDARYAHAVADARERVAEDLAAFCAINDCDTAAQSPAEGVVITPPPAP
jgi:hypothetical protein